VLVKYSGRAVALGGGAGCACLAAILRLLGRCDRRMTLPQA